MVNKTTKSILVIGAGVSGLTTALCLKEEGFNVKLVADKFAPQITSVVAGALWEWPPAVCGGEHDVTVMDRSKKWCISSYQKFLELEVDKETGVFLHPVVFYFKQPINVNLAIEEYPPGKVDSSSMDHSKMLETQAVVKDFLHDPNLIVKNGVNPSLNLKDAYTYLAPMIDTDTYIPWLYRQVQKAGISIFSKKISGLLKDLEAELLREFDVDLIINCTGLGSLEITNDSLLSPHRGALIRAINDGSSIPKITTAHCMTFDQYLGNQNMIFIVPRGTDRLLIGGLVEHNEWSTDINLENYSFIQDMFDRCVEFLPILKDIKLDNDEPVRVGLRPYRKHSVHLEHEPGTNIIHNYGHGGSGVTYSWGCAHEVVSLVSSMQLY
jgi:D-amino-acid oxidase